MKIKKTLLLVLILGLLVGLVAGCGTKKEDSSNANQNKKEITLKVGASPVPHKEILDAAKKALAEKGVKLEIIEFTDYVQPNQALAKGDIDANYFQHLPYLEDFSKKNNLDLTYTVKVHFEPLGIYPGKTKSLKELKEGESIAVPNDPTNEARALLLLQDAGVIKLKEGVGLEATKKDITSNPKKVDINELEAAQIPRAIKDVDLAVINGNYALEAGLSAGKDALKTETKDSLAAGKFANIIAIRKGDENKKAIKILGEVLNSPEIKKFIEDKYKGAVIPVF